jgi:hypothetical protein
MLKRIGVVIAVAVAASVALAVPVTAQTDARLTLQIDPKEGPVGTTINATVPEEYKQECLSEDELFAAFQALVASLVTQGTQPPLPDAITNVLESIDGAGLNPEDLNFTILFVLAFADIATQQPVTDETTGEQATSFWNPLTGQGTIDAPNVHPRPSLYAVAAVCLELKEPSQVNPEEVIQALQNVDPAAGPEGAAQALLLALINQEPRVAWASLFCLQGDNGEPCGAPAAAAEPVVAEPAFTG